MALLFAEQGYRTLALTVDPAKRLAQALGLDAFDHQIQRIWPKDRQFSTGKVSSLSRGSNNNKKYSSSEPGKGESRSKKRGSLDAMMLDTKRTFDKIIERYAPDREAAETIMNHPLYHHLSTMIAGSQEYMAMENLYHVVTEYDYDKIIVDTPPTQHALDFLDAPKKMVGAITNSMLKILIKPSAWAGKHGGRLLGAFGHFIGVQFLQELSDFLSSTVSLLDGFKERADEVIHLIESNQTKAILVATPTPVTVNDATQFMKAMRSRQLDVSACIINRTLPRPDLSAKSIKEAATWCNKQKDESLRAIGKEIGALQEIYQLENRLIKDLKSQSKRTPLYGIPRTEKPIHNLKGLDDLFSRMTLF